MGGRQLVENLTAPIGGAAVGNNDLSRKHALGQKSSHKLLYMAALIENRGND
jgi:hypothetical protein